MATKICKRELQNSSESTKNSRLALEQFARKLLGVDVEPPAEINIQDEIDEQEKELKKQIYVRNRGREAIMMTGSSFDNTPQMKELKQLYAKSEKQIIKIKRKIKKLQTQLPTKKQERIRLEKEAEKKRRKEEEKRKEEQELEDEKEYLEYERKEQERKEHERKEQERRERSDQERIRLEKERSEKERERKEQERIRLEKEAIIKEERKRERKEQERKEKEIAAKEKLSHDDIEEEFEKLLKLVEPGPKKMPKEIPASLGLRPKEIPASLGLCPKEMSKEVIKEMPAASTPAASLGALPGVPSGRPKEAVNKPPRLEIVDGSFGVLRIDENKLKAGKLEAFDQRGNMVMEYPADESLYRLLTKRFTKKGYSDEAIEIYSDLLKLSGLSLHGRKDCKKAELISRYRA